MSQTLPLVSVIITTYHNETYLPRAIESVLHQSYPNIELIVVDDNPPESEARANTEAVMDRYPQVVYLRHPKNLNGAAARNTGIRAAKGQYLAFLDNDDIYFSDHIADCVAQLQLHPECNSVVCGVIKIRGGLCWELINAPSADLARELLFRETALGTGSNLFVSTEATRSIGGFDERFRRHQDVEFGLRYFAQNKVCSLQKVQIIKEMDGFSNAPDFQRFLSTKQLLWDAFQQELEALTPEDRKRYFANQYTALLYTACKAGDRAQIKWVMDQLTAMRPANRKDHLLVTLSRLGLFNTYESIKKTVKALRSNRIRRQISKGLSDCDLTFFNDALAGGKRR
jgi:hypothetical protein